MQNNQISRLVRIGFLIFLGSLLSGCAGFTGLRTPLYDGEPVQYNEEAAEIYEERQEVTGDEKAYYFRYELSPDLWEPALSFTEAEPIILEEGTYEVGTDLPAGRAVLQGADSEFAPHLRIIHVGNITIYDDQEKVYFESLFNDASGIKYATVDLKLGHTVEVIGDSPEITVSYTESALPASGNQLIAGQYEVGKQIEPGTYQLANIQAPRKTILYWLQQGLENPRVIELIPSGGLLTEEVLLEQWENGLISSTEYELQMEKMTSGQENDPTIEFETGDKIYLPMLHSLELNKIESE
ncbi:hypothetical protein [Marinilactibacillus piezotolerans]|uniref:hypothetical protein n=1 Tax=Marinilactibacillus piezotolerans TaxID=258723 RepID=UPI0009B063CF|nr:hypothetical protein [Marinilactibacillus piezotolerans]